MIVAFVLRCDGRRQFIEQAITSAQEHIKGDFDHMFIVDDSGDQDYAHWLETIFPTFEHIHHPERLGMAAGWRTACEVTTRAGADYIFATEDDFVFTKKVPIKKMAAVLHCEPHLAQLVLKRQPGSPEEHAAGGIIEVAPELYEDKSCQSGQWVEHTRLFSFNPTLIRKEALEAFLSNPGDGLERGTTDALLARGYKFGVWGTREDAPRTIHIGDTRSSGYRW